MVDVAGQSLQGTEEKWPLEPNVYCRGDWLNGWPTDLSSNGKICLTDGLKSLEGTNAADGLNHYLLLPKSLCERALEEWVKGEHTSC